MRIISIGGYNWECVCVCVCVRVRVREREREREREGSVIGKNNIFVLKFSNDLALIADYPQGLDEMIKTLKRYVVKNRLLEVNVKK